MTLLAVLEVLKCAIFVRKRVSLKLEWVKNHDTKPTKKKKKKEASIQYLMKHSKWNQEGGSKRQGKDLNNEKLSIWRKPYLMGQ